LGTLNTLVLICSSTTIVMAQAASQRAAVQPTRLWLLATIALGSTFLIIKAVEYSAKFSHHILPSTGIFWSCYFTLTGFHALHVLGGVLYNVWVLAVTFDESVWPRRPYLLELAGLYWHFVDIVWIFLFPLVYLL
jgi:heme/copper-type cytochrome/quinol oxidase subunit 3